VPLFDGHLPRTQKEADFKPLPIVKSIRANLLDLYARIMSAKFFIYLMQSNNLANFGVEIGQPFGVVEKADHLRLWHGSWYYTATGSEEAGELDAWNTPEATLTTGMTQVLCKQSLQHRTRRCLARTDRGVGSGAFVGHAPADRPSDPDLPRKLPRLDFLC
jgi:hypothetical protein